MTETQFMVKGFEETQNIFQWFSEKLQNLICNTMYDKYHLLTSSKSQLTITIQNKSNECKVKGMFLKAFSKHVSMFLKACLSFHYIHLCEFSNRTWKKKRQNMKCPKIIQEDLSTVTFGTLRKIKNSTSNKALKCLKLRIPSFSSSTCNK